MVGIEDGERLIKPKAFVVLKPGYGPGVRRCARAAGARQGYAAPYKYPRWIEFVEDLPKTATGKISGSSCAASGPWRRRVASPVLFMWRVHQKRGDGHGRKGQGSCASR